jgi:enamine deaminase RidA (YjgF/YER057c/UK114 family)
MPIQYFSPPTLATSSYSHAISVSDGNLIFVAGQVAFDVAGNVIGRDLESQAGQVYQNLKAALAAAGATFDDVIKITTYVTKPEYLGRAKDVRMPYFASSHQPTSTGLVVVGLAHPDLLIEVEAIAFLTGFKVDDAS